VLVWELEFYVLFMNVGVLLLYLILSPPSFSWLLIIDINWTFLFQIKLVMGDNTESVEIKCDICETTFSAKKNLIAAYMKITSLIYKITCMYVRVSCLSQDDLHV
jgi:hypothetical protein